MTQVKVGLSAIVRHKYLAMLVRRHRARIDIQIGVKLDYRYVDAPVLEHPANRSAGDALAQRTGNSTRDEDVSPGRVHSVHSLMQL